MCKISFVSSPDAVSSLDSKSMACTSRDSVLASPELLEEILLSLPLRDLLLAQQISRSVQHLIQSSSRIQKALFLKPQVSSPTELLSSSTHQADGLTGPVEINPLLQTLLPCFYNFSKFNQKANFEIRDIFVPDPGEFGKAEDVMRCLEPFARPRPPEQAQQARKASLAIVGQMGRHDTDPPLAFDAITRRGVSWRRMLPMQPAYRSLLLIRVSKQWTTNMSTNIMRGNGPDGSITMGQLFDLCARFVICGQQSGAFAIDWLGDREPQNHWRLRISKVQLEMAMERLEPDMGVVWICYSPSCVMEYLGGREYMCEEEDTKASLTSEWVSLPEWHETFTTRLT